MKNNVDISIKVTNLCHINYRFKTEFLQLSVQNLCFLYDLIRDEEVTDHHLSTIMHNIIEDALLYTKLER